jgi:hypothetical protein
MVRFLVLALRRIVMEAVIHTFVNMYCVLYITLLKRRFIHWPSGIDAFIMLSVMKQERSFDFRRLLDLRLHLAKNLYDRFARGRNRRIDPVAPD